MFTYKAIVVLYTMYTAYILKNGDQYKLSVQQEYLKEQQSDTLVRLATISYLLEFYVRIYSFLKNLVFL